MPRYIAVLALALALVVLAPPALAAYPPWVLAIRDCADDGDLDGTYPARALIEALHNLPSDGGEYSDCAASIQRALEGGSGKPHAPAPPGITTESGAVATSQEDVAALQTVVATAGLGRPAPVALPAHMVVRIAAPDDAVVLSDLGSPAATHYPVRGIAGGTALGLFLIALLAATRRRQPAL